MKKRLVPVLLVAALLMTGCHGAREKRGFDVPESFDEGKSYSITFWAKNDTNKTQTDIYQKAAENFETFYPNIDVNIKFYTDYGKIYNDVITNISTDTTPNVCITYPDHIATYMTGQETVVALDDLINDGKYGLGGSEVKFDSVSRSQIIDTFLEEGRLNGHYYALPFMRSTEACYINADFVGELGYEIPDVLTWDYIWEVSEAALEKREDGMYRLNGGNVMIPFIYKSTDNMMISYLFQKGAGYSDQEGDIRIFNDTTKDFLKDIAGHAATGAFSTFKISGYPANFLCAGQCVFAIDSTAGATWMGSNAPHSDIASDKVVKFETVVRPIPQADVNDLKMMSQGPSICIFNKTDPGEVMASWLFAQFLLTDGVQLDYAKTEGYVPVTSKARETDEYESYLSKRDENSEEYYSVKIDATGLLLENTEHTFVTPVFNGSASLRDAAGAMVEDVVKTVKRKQTVDDDYFTELFEEMSSLYRLYERPDGSTDHEISGELPIQSKLLITGFIVIWILIIAYVLADHFRRRKNG